MLSSTPCASGVRPSGATTPTCRFSVQDPNKVEGTSPAACARLRTQRTCASSRSIPDDPRPALAAHTPFDNGGVLFVERYPQQSDFVDIGVAVCRLVRPERSVAYELAFPTASWSGHGQQGQSHHRRRRSADHPRPAGSQHRSEGQGSGGGRRGQRGAVRPLGHRRQPADPNPRASAGAAAVRWSCRASAAP